MTFLTSWFDLSSFSLPLFSPISDNNYIAFIVPLYFLLFSRTLYLQEDLIHLFISDYNHIQESDPISLDFVSPGLTLGKNNNNNNNNNENNNNDNIKNPMYYIESRMKIPRLVVSYYNNYAVTVTNNPTFTY